MPGDEAEPGRREALIIAPGRYQDPQLARLRSPSRDVAKLAKVLSNQAVGGFTVHVRLDEAGHLLREEVDGFFTNRRPEDLLVLYLSCHGVKDMAGQLQFAVSTTKLSRLPSTGISASFIYEQVHRCRARRILLLLDCCYSGAYSKGQRPKAESRADIRPFEGRGRAVITSCTALEYDLEVDTRRVTGNAAPSVFTSALAEGLRTGQADGDGDGLVSVDELFTYVLKRVRQATPDRIPEKKWGDIRGDFVIARNPAPPVLPTTTAVTTVGLDSHARKRAPTRRLVIGLGLSAVSAAGLGIAGWDLTHQTPVIHRPSRKIAHTPKPLWTFNSPAGLAGPSLQVVGGVVLTNGNSETYALRASDGARLWRSPISGPFITSSDGTIIYAYHGNAVYALRIDNGHTIWHSPVSSPSMIQTGDGVLCTTDQYGTVHALSAVDGTKLWSFATSQGEPAGLAVAAGVVFTAGANQGASVYAIRAGNQIWKSPVGSVDPTVGIQIVNGIVYLNVISENGPQVYALRSADGVNLWISNFDVPSVSAIITTNRLYIIGIGGIFHALNPRTGTILWSYLIRPKVFGAEPLATRDAVYFSNRNTLSALRASNGTKIWEYSSGNAISDLALTGGAVCIASNDLYILNIRNGSELWSYPVQAETVVAEGNVVYISSTTGKLYALPV
jgi:outer membrane protein assembly factor BamB